MVRESSINFLVDGIVNSKQEIYSAATSYYLLVSQDGCQTTWHQDFTSTSVMYTVLSGQKTFFVIAPTSHNLKLFEEFNEKETDQR